MNDLKKQNILVVTRIMDVGGTENVILQICGFLHTRVNKIVVCAAKGKSMDKLEEMGINYYVVPDIAIKTPRVAINVLRAYQHIISVEDITLIHAHDRMAAFYISLIKEKNMNFVVTAHNNFKDKCILTRFAYRNAKIIACGEDVKRTLIKYNHISADSIKVIANAIKPFCGEVYIDEYLENLKRQGFYLIGNIGRLSKQKGIEFFIQSAEKIVRVHPEARFLIIGTGEEEKKLKEISHKLGMDCYVHFMGYKSDIQNLMSQLDLIVLTSLWEGFPLTPIEAFSVGKTIVATSVEGTREIVKDRVNGILVESINPESIANKIVWMIEHPEEQKQMEKEAKNTYESKFSYKMMSDLYIKYYERIIDEQRR